jgi:hypothetical protein
MDSAITQRPQQIPMDGCDGEAMERCLASVEARGGMQVGGATGLGIRRAVAKAGYRDSAGDLVRLSTQLGPTMHERANRAVAGDGCVDLPLLWLGMGTTSQYYFWLTHRHQHFCSIYVLAFFPDSIHQRPSPSCRFYAEKQGRPYQCFASGEATHSLMQALAQLKKPDTSAEYTRRFLPLTLAFCSLLAV